MSEKVLTSSGVSELWDAVKKRSLPVKAVTKEEYDDLSEGEKKSDTLFIVDGGDEPDIPASGSNQNILDNWYFIGGGSQQSGGQFPINQRGKTEYNGTAYGIDRWKFSAGASSSVKIEADGIVITNTVSTNWFMQRIDNPEAFAGKTVAVSVLGTSSVGFRPHIQYNSGDNITGGKYVSMGVATMTATLPDDITSLRVGVVLDTNASSAKIYAVKLELGPVQTLAHQEDGNWVLNDPPPNYALELAKCLRYQVVLSATSPSYASRSFALGIYDGGYAEFFFHEFNFRVSPAVTIEGTFKASQTFSTAGSYGVTYVGAYYLSVNGCGLRFSVASGHPYKAGDMVVLIANNDATAKIIFDANL